MSLRATAKKEAAWQKLIPATICNTQKGTKIVADSGFTCMRIGTVKTVQEDAAGLWVKCAEGHHYLDGQLGNGGVYVGLRLAAVGSKTP